MKNEQSVKNKFKELYDKTLKERIEKYQSKNHLNCIFNERCRIRNNGMVGFCNNKEILKETKKGFFVCNNEDTVFDCKEYQCFYTTDKIKKDLDDILKNPSLCGKEYPKLGVLLWVLQNEEKK